MSVGRRAFMDAVLSTARAAGWPEGQPHHEFFAAEPVARRTDASFEVRLASSGQVIYADGQYRGAGPSGSRCVRANVVRARRLRHLRGPGARGRARPPGSLSDSRRAGGKRPVHAMLLACEISSSGSGSLKAAQRTSSISEVIQNGRLYPKKQYYFHQ